MNDSPIYKAIQEVILQVDGYHLNAGEIHVKTDRFNNAITDDVFYQELGHRLGTNYPVVSDGPITLTRPIKWEYFVKDLYIEGQSPTAQMSILDHYGKQGYELITVVNSLAYFKRQCSLQ